MHASSWENMRKCSERYIDTDFLKGRKEVSVLDVGGADVNGSYSEIFVAPRFRYVAADMEAGEGVELVLADPYHIPMADASVDIVISGQMLEHCEFFWLSFEEMVRVVKLDGFIFLIAPSAGPIHQYPVDCYRFYPDAYRALAKYANCHLIEVWRDERGPWCDLVGVFRKQWMPARTGAAPAAQQHKPGRASSSPFPPGPPEVEVVQGSKNRKDLLLMVHEILAPEVYLEIGVRHGFSLSMASCRAVGVDPFPEITYPLGPGTELIEQTSDAFFESRAAEVLSTPPDLVYIDGSHLFEYVLRDFMNVERLATPTTLIVLDDIFPSHPRQAARERSTRVWTGEIWKFHACLARLRPDLLLLPVDARPTGLLLVAGLDPANRILWKQYNPTVRRYKDPSNAEPPPSVIHRKGAVPGDSARVREILELLRDLRLRKATKAQTAATIAEVRAAVSLSSP